MTNSLVFNHHSLPFQDRDKASGYVVTFLRICIGVQNTGFSVIMLDQNQDPTWFSMELAPNYFWRDWYAAAIADPKLKDQITAFRSIQTRTPLFKSEDIGGDLELFDVYEITTDQAYPALRSAAWYQCPLVSFPTIAPWDQNPLRIRIDIMQDSKEGKFERKSAVITNFHSLAEWEREKPGYVEQRSKAIKNGIMLWAARKTVFSALGFCSKTESQFNSWSHPENIFEQVNASLLILNRFCEKWKENGYPDYSHKNLKAEGMNRQVSGESDSVQTHPSKKLERMLFLPDGRCEYFENHIKLSMGYRIHFFPDSHEKKIWIGYVGPHLTL